MVLSTDAVKQKTHNAADYKHHNRQRYAACRYGCCVYSVEENYWGNQINDNRGNRFFFDPQIFPRDKPEENRYVQGDKLIEER